MSNRKSEMKEKGDGDAHGRSTGNAENIRIRQFIAKERLHDEAADGKRGAYLSGKENARKTDMKKDLGGRISGEQTGKRGKAARAYAEPCQGGQGQKSRTHGNRKTLRMFAASALFIHNATTAFFREERRPDIRRRPKDGGKGE